MSGDDDFERLKDVRAILKKRNADIASVSPVGAYAFLVGVKKKYEFGDGKMNDPVLQ